PQTFLSSCSCLRLSGLGAMPWRRPRAPAHGETDRLVILNERTNHNMETAVASALPLAVVQPATPQIVFSKERAEQVLKSLAQPFDPPVVKWVVKATAESKEGKRRGLVAAYADPRAYSDRLNQLLTPLGWTQNYS